MKRLRGLLAAGMMAAALTMGGSPTMAEPSGTMTWTTHLPIVPAWVDPADHTGSQPTEFVYYALHDKLVKPMPEGLYTPSLAESWTRSDDGMVYEFKIREGVTFHNGDPLTAEDAKFSLDRYRGAGASYLKDRIASVEVPDPMTLRVTLKAPWPDFMQYYTTSQTGAAWVVPKKYIEEVGEQAFMQAPIGAGPYKYKSFTPGVEMVVEANTDYWRKEPSVETLVFKVVPEELTRAAMLKNGEADVGTFFRGPTALDLEATEGITMIAPRIFFTQWVTFTEQWDEKSPWSNVKVRQAVNYAINREGIAEAEFLGWADPAGNIVHPGVMYAKKIEAYPYDPEKAKQLLAEAGYPDGFDGGDLHVDTAYGPLGEALQNDLQAIGINMRIRKLDRAAYFAGMNEKSLHGLIYLIYAGYDNAGSWLDQFVSPEGRSTFGTYPELTELMKQQAVEINEEKRAELLDQAQTIVHEKAMFAPILYALALSAHGPRVEESGLNLIDGFPYSAPYEDVKLKAE